jgi:hypothetical protein
MSTMLMQGESCQRTVLLENLRAMCKHTSGTCHRYTVEQVSWRGPVGTVRVAYSNPDEYGRESPMVALFPCYRSSDYEPDRSANPWVVLDFLNVLCDTWDGEGWQAFEALLDCPELFRNPQTGGWSPAPDAATA